MQAFQLPSLSKHITSTNVQDCFCCHSLQVSCEQLSLNRQSSSSFAFLIMLSRLCAVPHVSIYHHSTSSNTQSKPRIKHPSAVSYKFRMNIHGDHPPTPLTPPLPLPIRRHPNMQRQSRPRLRIIRLIHPQRRLLTPKAREARPLVIRKVPHIIQSIQHPTLDAHPPVYSVAAPLRLAVLIFARFQDLHAARAVQGDDGLSVAPAGFEGLVEAAPGCFAEGLGFEGEGVKGFACEVHSGDLDGAEV